MGQVGTGGLCKGADGYTWDRWGQVGCVKVLMDTHGTGGDRWAV